MSISECTLCPRRCRVERKITKGYCGMPEKLTLARADLHFWEEPCISGTNGSGAVFFSGCSLGCVYCQNNKISRNHYGCEISVQRLGEIFFELYEKGAHNINLVNPSHYTDKILEALKARPPLPVVWNSSGYELPETIRKTTGFVDIFMPDFKYSDAYTAKRYSNAPDYFEAAAASIKQMFLQTGPVEFDKNGILKRGLIIRHLVLPGCEENTRGVLDWVSENFNDGDILFSLMGQYIPAGKANSYPEINRRLTQDEYNWAQNYMQSVGIYNGYVQDLNSAAEEFVPEFDCTGV